MFANILKLNPEKTEFILIGSKNNRKQLLPHFPINILSNQVSPAQSVRNPWSGVRLQLLILRPCITGHKVHQSSCERPL